MITGHGGNIFALAAELGCAAEQILDFSSNINPLGTMPELLDLLRQSLDTIVCLPEVDNRRIIQDFSACHQVAPDHLLAGSGTTQFIYTLPKALGTQKALILAPTYADYADSCRFQGVAWDYFFSHASKAFRPDLAGLDRAIEAYDTVYLCNPNNPTGYLIPGRSLIELCAHHPDTRFIVDESYLPFAPDGRDHSLLHTPLPNPVVLHSLSKIFGIPGLRIGFIKADPSIIRAVEPHLPPWSVNTLAQTAAAYVLSHPRQTDAFIQRTQTYLASERQNLAKRLQTSPYLDCFPSTTSFVLIRLPQGMQASALCRHLTSQRMLIRNCSNFTGLDNRYIRIALKSPQANQKVTLALLQWLDRQPLAPGGNP